eukprot:Plantae.Rhodophyta-Purpureofilum_apyrenoidigerum.ctg3687.p1 GENE.Plantae.Rhodophyta-Purpureofilum_apyrenoidigerum.ctg3687~~Plantae.Rhodophyta-Purpureofilum_apyrenoidigerum.ctg3687.p1  ORF type:complete len:380 (+),score=55.31 Plantae.Rhodophyta-Purpureofilum_apyrenoidigerum.ctg3687:180-1319(+)
MSADFGQGRSSTSAPVGGMYTPFSIFLYGGVTQEDEHVTVWEPRTGKTVAGNAAPYRKNLRTWLAGHPGWEEKADELKSSKRRSAARRQKAVSAAFAALCVHGGELPHVIMKDAIYWLREGGFPDAPSQDSEWTSEEDTKLKENLVHLGEEIFNNEIQSEFQWKRITSGFAPRWNEAEVLRRARDLLRKGLLSYANEARTYSGTPTAYGSPLDGGPSFSPMSSSLSYLERHLIAPREPRITVWEPSTGRTVSGNAAPCRRNLDAWMRGHPGWEVKSEELLSSSRRIKGKRMMTSQGDAHPLSTSTPLFNTAIDGLIMLGQSPQVGSVPLRAQDDKMETSSAMSEMDVDDAESDPEPEENEGVSHPPLQMRTSSPMQIPE